MGVVGSAIQKYRHAWRNTDMPGTFYAFEYEHLMKLGILISGTGSNMMAIHRETREGILKDLASVACVIADKECQGLAYASTHRIPHTIVSPKTFSSKADWNNALADALKQHDVELVILAGFMRLIGPELLLAFPQKILNIHPSLLPAFPGKDAIQQALDAGAQIAGCTVHLVDEGMDTGPILDQSIVTVEPGDTVPLLSKKIHDAEHQLYPKVIRQIAQRHPS